MSTVLWKGVYPAVLTPFKNDDSIDFDTFKLNILLILVISLVDSFTA